MSSDTEIALIDAVRTPHGTLLGPLADHSAVDLGTVAVEGLFERTDVDPDLIDWVGLGHALQAGLGQVPARQVVLNADLPPSTPATTINEASGSGLRAIALGVDRLLAGRREFAVAGGMESMSNAPYLLHELRRGRRYGDTKLVDSMIYDALWDVTEDAHMGELTEALVDRVDISREAQDEYAAQSHQRAVDAREHGTFDDEIVPVPVGDDVLDEDDGPRADTTLEGLARLSPAFVEDGTITAGNASDLSDGAGAVLLGSESATLDAGFDPLAWIVDYHVAYRDPKWFGMAVGDAVQGLLRANDLAVDDVDSFELNEAFAAQMVYVRERCGIPTEKLNPNGGAIALGHPIGASGGMLTTSLVHRMVERGSTYGVVGMSVGGGGGIAMLLRR
ncbi:acetyl-CoA C-acetyltransferase [Halogranum amylolyticum]|uniref:Acetyl-CoA C-acetyltransferase n=1 Tax=Halogranum amylolyticum TaxID=660520 RepID=A0A1H8N202_9EURY|nr:thiolase family protein [Halogranum amylolyticum]SEO23549.1 acetyl-CoA C-acetyltransferase [Halogranum amylolyticum]